MSHGPTPRHEPPISTPGRRPVLALLGFAMAGALSACGKKGPLRLPEPAPPTAAADEETE